MTSSARLMTPKEVAGLLRVSKSTLKNWRRFGGGPPFQLVGRQVRYELADVQDWAAKRGLRGER